MNEYPIVIRSKSQINNIYHCFTLCHIIYDYEVKDSNRFMNCPNIKLIEYRKNNFSKTLILNDDDTLGCVYKFKNGTYINDKCELHFDSGLYDILDKIIEINDKSKIGNISFYKNNLDSIINEVYINRYDEIMKILNETDDDMIIVATIKRNKTFKSINLYPKIINNGGEIDLYPNIIDNGKENKENEENKENYVDDWTQDDDDDEDDEDYEDDEDDEDNEDYEFNPEYPIDI